MVCVGSGVVGGLAVSCCGWFDHFIFVVVWVGCWSQIYVKPGKGDVCRRAYMC